MLFINKLWSLKMNGKQAEILAKICLFCKGYQILESNYVTGKGTKAGEIDIIARKAQTLVFVEVKKRKNLETSAYAISDMQKQRICCGVEAYLKFHQQYKSFSYRIDAILVAPICKVSHIKNAWLFNENMHF